MFFIITGIVGVFVSIVLNLRRKGDAISNLLLGLFVLFHSLFLLELSKFLGFYPQEIDVDATRFNLLEGRFQNHSGQDHILEGENLIIFKKALGIKFDAFTTFNLPSKQRQMLLNMILAYFQLHLDDFKKPKSLAVLNQVFN